MSVAATAAVAAGTAAVVVSTGHGDPTGGPRVENTLPLDRDVPLVAATNAAKAPTGKYWHTKTVMGEVYAVGKSAADHFKVDSRQGNETWTDRTGLSRGTPLRPGGCPPHPVGQAEMAGGGIADLGRRAGSRGRRGEGQPGPVSEGGQGRPVAAVRRSVPRVPPAQIAAPPTEPEALKKVLLGLRGHWHAVSTDGEKEEPIRALRGRSVYGL